MFINPDTLASDLDKLEGIEKATVRLVTQAIYEFREVAEEIFCRGKDLPADIAEDITREALDRIGVSKMDVRLFGKIDYKRARYVFNRDYAIRQALFVDSKAEKSDPGTVTLQTSETSMVIRHIRRGSEVEECGQLPTIIETKMGKLLTTTVVVKHNYRALPEQNQLVNIIVAAIPNQMLQARYNPTSAVSIWRAGRNAPTRGEKFRVRLVFDLLRQKAAWRVQTIPMAPREFKWDD